MTVIAVGTARRSATAQGPPSQQAQLGQRKAELRTETRAADSTAVPSVPAGCNCRKAFPRQAAA